jgi:hypothetical protein
MSRSRSNRDLVEEDLIVPDDDAIRQFDSISDRSGGKWLDSIGTSLHVISQKGQERTETYVIALTIVRP